MEKGGWKRPGVVPYPTTVPDCHHDKKGLPENPPKNLAETRLRPLPEIRQYDFTLLDRFRRPGTMAATKGEPQP